MYYPEIADLLVESKINSALDIIDIKILHGGLTNKIYRCITDQGDYVVREYLKDDKDSLRERNILQELSSVQCVPKLIKEIDNYLILEYVQGKPLSLVKLRKPEKLHDLALVLKQLHTAPSYSRSIEDNILSLIHI